MSILTHELFIILALTLNIKSVVQTDLWGSLKQWNTNSIWSCPPLYLVSIGAPTVLLGSALMLVNSIMLLILLMSSIHSPNLVCRLSLSPLSLSLFSSFPLRTLTAPQRFEILCNSVFAHLNCRQIDSGFLCRVFAMLVLWRAFGFSIVVTLVSQVTFQQQNKRKLKVKYCIKKMTGRYFFHYNKEIFGGLMFFDLCKSNYMFSYMLYSYMFNMNTD